jgi:hypothetical protein
VFQSQQTRCLKGVGDLEIGVNAGQDVTKNVQKGGNIRKYDKHFLFVYIMCVIVYTNIKDDIILAKNRDRVYRPNVQIIHEIVNGIEIAYINDINSGWIEGINEHGTAIVNSTLNIHDGKENKFKKIKVKGNKIYHTLCEIDDTKVLNHMLSKDNKSYIIEGHTFLHVNGVCYHIENNIKNEYIITRAKPNDVYTNHGKWLKNDGYIEGKKGVSSYLRKKITENEINHTTFMSYDDVANAMNKNYTNIDPRFHTYRDKKTSKKFLKDKSNKNRYVSTTGQLIMNITNKELVYYTDKNNSKNVTYVNRLPKNYNPKIRIIIKETEKNLVSKRRVFSKKFLKDTYSKFNYTSKKKSVNHVKNKTRKHKTRKG